MRKRSQKIDRDLLHEYMWEHSDPRSHKFLKSQVQLADELDVTPATICYIMNEFQASGRVRKKKSHFFVTDPQSWKWKRP